MNYKKPFITLFAAAILLIGIHGTGSAQQPVDNAIYAGLLEKYVHNGRVDYKGLKKDEAALDEYLKQMSRIDPAQLDRSGQMAFYINLYNAATIKLILTGYPGITSIKDLGTLFQSPWKKEFVRLNGRTTTLDHVEHGILRSQFKDPRIHFAINCASRSCPPLSPEPYTGSTLEEQLNKSTTNFINNPQSNFIQDGALHASRIFKWFSEDFDDDMPAFFNKYARDPLKGQLSQLAQPLKVDYLEYDWSLNGE